MEYIKIIVDVAPLILRSMFIGIFIVSLFIFRAEDILKKDVSFSKIVKSVLTFREEDILKNDVSFYKIAGILVTFILTACIITSSFLIFKIPANILNAPIIVSIICLILRYKRPYFRKDISNKTQNLFTLVDLIVIYIVLYNIFAVAEAFIENNLLSIQIAFIWPAIYILGGCYTLFYLGYLKPRNLKISTWRLLAYAFPEAGEHQKKKVIKNYYYSVTVSSTLGMFLFFVLNIFAYLISYKITSNGLIAQIVCIFYMVSLGILIVFGWWDKTSESIVINKILLLIKQGGFFAVCLSAILLLSETFSPEKALYMRRYVYASIIMAPFLIFTSEYLPVFPKQIMNKLRSIYKDILGVKSIILVSDAATKCILGKNKGELLRSALIAFVLILYLIVPHLENFFILAGIKEIHHIPIHTVFETIREISNKWEVPDKLNKAQFRVFIFGNHGLIFMSLLWYFISLILWFTNIASRLKKIPNQFYTKTDEISLELWILLFYLLFLPSLLILGFLIPIMGSFIFGEHLAIILGVFTFGLLYPWFVGFLLTIAYLIAITLTTDLEKHALDINSAKFEDLMLLPDVGRKKAHTIINNRPIQDSEELAHFIGRKTIDEISSLIRFSAIAQP